MLLLRIFLIALLGFQETFQARWLITYYDYSYNFNSSFGNFTPSNGTEAGSLWFFQKISKHAVSFCVIPLNKLSKILL